MIDWSSITVSSFLSFDLGGEIQQQLVAELGGELQKAIPDNLDFLRGEAKVVDHARTFAETGTPVTEATRLLPPASEKMLIEIVAVLVPITV